MEIEDYLFQLTAYTGQYEEFRSSIRDLNRLIPILQSIDKEMPQQIDVPLPNRNRPRDPGRLRKPPTLTTAPPQFSHRLLRPVIPHSRIHVPIPSIQYPLPLLPVPRRFGRR